MVIFDHEVTRQYDTELALAPPSVDVDEVLRRNAASLKILWIPGRKSLRHCTLQEPILRSLLGELEVQRLAQGRDILVLRLIPARTHDDKCGVGIVRSAKV